MDRLCKLLTRFSLAASIDTSHWEFPDVCQYYFGSFGRWSSLLFSLVSLVGAMIVYWVLMSNFFFNTGKFIYNYVHHVNVTEIGLSTNGSDRVICPDTEDPPPSNHTVGLSAGNTTGLLQFEEWWSKTNTVPLYLIVVLLPLLNFRSPSFFAKFNVLGMWLACCVRCNYLVAQLTQHGAAGLRSFYPTGLIKGSQCPKRCLPKRLVVACAALCEYIACLGA
ncbi:hypothetical protein GDO78_022975 [Eleutherodactylus coqui]|uniref:Uncharacterized protein n=1 Tax=Eleutherodactylus coqui TaxID=57060 RepID=A0A8J6E4R2_ELECQ|nr:hypothetical protein GDO78_022975 [Eleutherodactylus coqui]